MGYFNEEVRRRLGPSYSKYADFQGFSGTDIHAVLYLPLLTKGTITGKEQSKIKVFGTLQTISISSTRSVSPIRVLGRSSPKAYSRGARTFAGTMVFASLNSDVFNDVYDIGIAENTYAASTSLVADQLPPFSIVISAVNESGGAAIHIVHGITLTNYGTTYSIDDLYTETTYSYVATDVIPMIADSMSSARAKIGGAFEQLSGGTQTVSQHLRDKLRRSFGTDEAYAEAIRKQLGINQNERL